MTREGSEKEPETIYVYKLWNHYKCGTAYFLEKERWRVALAGEVKAYRDGARNQVLMCRVSRSRPETG